MDGQQILTGIGIVAIGALQYGLMLYALNDLRHRAAVRWNNKIGWILIILCIPFAGALAYAAIAPVSDLGDREPTFDSIPHIAPSGEESDETEDGDQRAVNNPPTTDQLSV